MRQTTPGQAEHLPLTATDLHVLLALERGPLYGYALLQSMGDDSRGHVQPDIGSLYRTLQRLSTTGLIGEVPAPKPTAAPGKPRRYYAITTLGAEVLEADLERLRRIVDQRAQVVAGGAPT